MKVNLDDLAYKASKDWTEKERIRLWQETLLNFYRASVKLCKTDTAFAREAEWANRVIQGVR